MTPVLLVLGPSGAGKSFVAKGLADHHAFYHFDLNDTFRGNGFPAEWDTDKMKIDFAQLVAVAHSRIEAAQCAGAVLSFPADYVLTPQQVDAAARAGVT